MYVCVDECVVRSKALNHTVWSPGAARQTAYGFEKTTIIKGFDTAEMIQE